MATEAVFNSAKDAWHDATEKAVTTKENAKERYNEEKEYGTTTESFDEWIKTNVST